MQRDWRMVEYNLPNSKELEERAYRCRSVAGGMRHADTRQELLRIADDYDLLAQRVNWEERLRLRDRLKRLR
jgi:hypothetical protein